MSYLASREDVKTPIGGKHHQHHSDAALGDHSQALSDHFELDEHVRLSQDPEGLSQELLHSREGKEHHSRAVVRHRLGIWDLQEPQPHTSEKGGP